MRTLHIGLLVLLPACSGMCGSGGAVADAASAPSGNASTKTTAATVEASTAMKACTVSSPQVVDKAVRTDAGLTIVTMADGRLAVGYATAKGEPAAAIVDEEGKPTTLSVPMNALQTPPAKPGTRVFQRITPLGFADGGLDMHVALDVLDVKDDKSQSLRCGPADDKPLASSDSDPKTKDCRTFSDGTRQFALVSTVDGDTVRWLIDSSTESGPGPNDVLYEAKFTTEKLAQPARYLFQVPVAAFSPTGVLLAAREDGGLVLARRDSSFAPFGKPARFWHGAATTMPAVALHEHDAAVFFSLQGQRDIYGAAFMLEAKDIPRPEKITIDDPSPPSEGERASVSAAFSSTGNVLLAFADGKAGARHGRVAVLGKDLKTLVPPAEIASSVSELRVVAFPNGKALVLWIGTHDGIEALQAAPLVCPSS